MSSRRASPILLLALLLVASSAVAKSGRPLRSQAPGPAPNAVLLPGDDFATAFVVTALPYTSSVNLCGYSNDFESTPCNVQPGADVVYTFTPATDVRVRARTCNAAYLPFAVDVTTYEDGVLDPIDCADFAACGPNYSGQSHMLELSAGHKYYFLVDTYSPLECGSIDFSLEEFPAQPGQPGETIATAIPIPSLPFSASGDLAAFLPDLPLDCAVSGSPDVFFRFTPTSPSCVNISLCDSDYDTALSLYRDEGGTLVACDDDSCADPGYLGSSLMGQLLEGGVTYVVGVSGYDRGTGRFVLSLSDCPPTKATPTTWGRLKQHYR